MKQGRASHSGPGDRKIEPRVHAINPGYAGQIGIAQAVPRAVEPMSAGRGFMSPAPRSMTIHNRGSQGKHK